MVTVFRQEDGSYLVPMELPEDKGARKALLDYAKIQGYKVDTVQYGYRKYRAVLVPGSEGLFHSYIAEEGRNQRYAQLDRRCLIPGEDGNLKRCPLRIPNPNYGEPGENKTVINDCKDCPHRDSLRKVTSAPISMTGVGGFSEDGEQEDMEIPVGIAPDGDLFEKYSSEVMDFIREKYPEHAEMMQMLFDGYRVKEIAEKLNINRDTVRNRVKSMKKDLTKFIDSIIIFD
ncbi:LuxR C-terminal-related transcriptional regulator [uncultured Dysosmobacter sp.]|uniref:LuxR C-terminal-related transcriptional regulator n=1 Tax=uncultured Dysosmobacter sp. TaxID=2591384 RepID=UPI002610C01B|nr:LuxR C-terminal-related transcriptional regulator [uncultured Dysosmobacter sp.]